MGATGCNIAAGMKHTRKPRT